MPDESKRSWTLEKIEFLVSQILDYIDDQKTTIDSALDSSSTNPVQNSAIVTALNNKVTGPSTAVDSQVAIFDGTTGKLIKDSGFTIGKSVPSDAKFSDTNTKVTSVGNHYTPATNAASELTANAANGTAAWSTDVVTGITISRDAKGHVTDVNVASGKIPANPNTDTSVTSSTNHYTPVTASGSDVTASASGATAAWNIDVVQGITLNTDGKGHVTGMSVTSGKIPAQPTIPSAASSSPGKVASLSAVGTSTNYARQDHTHGIDLATGDNNGEIKIAGTNVAVKGLGSNAYTSTAYAPVANPIFTGTVSMETSGIGMRYNSTTECIEFVFS